MQQLTSAETNLLRSLWSLGTATIRELAMDVYGHDDDSKTASVQKLLSRMQAKGFVEKESGQRPQAFRAVPSEQEFLQRQLQHLAAEHCDGNLIPLATALLTTKGLKKRQRQKLRALVDELFPESESSGD